MTVPGVVTAAMVRVASEGSSRGLLGEPEVEHLDRAGARGQHDVFGLEIAMHDAGGVRGGHGVGDLDGDFDGAADGTASIAQEGAQSVALDEFGDQEGLAVVLAELVDGDDVGVVQRGQGAGFLLEAGAAGWSRARSGGRILRATTRWSCSSRARQTWPMPPSPSFERISYLPRREPVTQTSYPRYPGRPRLIPSAETYSERSTCTGSMRMARSRGGRAATMAAANRNSAGSASAITSVALTW